MGNDDAQKGKDLVKLGTTHENISGATLTRPDQSGEAQQDAAH